MPRRRFRYDRELDRMVEIPIDESADDHCMVRGDVPAFRSPLDGTIVEGRRAYQEHMRKHGVVPYEEGSAAVRPSRTPQERQAMREFLWEKLDRVARGHKARD